MCIFLGEMKMFCGALDQWFEDVTQEEQLLFR